MNWIKITQLHIVILLGSLIPIIALFISLPAIEIILLRTLIAVLFLGAGLMLFKKKIKLPPNEVRTLIASGIITSLYWTLLFISAKVSNASVSLIGIASASVWTSFILPVFQKRKISIFQLALGVLAMLGIMIIKNKDFEYNYGLIIALAAGFFGALLTVLNAGYVRKNNYYVITFYQMIGAFFATALLIPVYRFLGFAHGPLNFSLSINDFLWIVALAIVFSIVLYAQLIRLVKTISPYIVTLAANMTPIYGMLMALILHGETEVMSLSFYMGTFLIVISVAIYPIIEQYIPQEALYPPKEKKGLAP